MSSNNAITVNVSFKVKIKPDQQPDDVEIDQDYVESIFRRGLFGGLKLESIDETLERHGMAMNGWEITDVDGAGCRNLRLMEFDPSRKIAVIKAIRQATGLGLKESKDRADAVQSGLPQLVLENTSPSHVKVSAKFFDETGADIEVF